MKEAIGGMKMRDTSARLGIAASPSRNDEAAQRPMERSTEGFPDFSQSLWLNSEE
jgi:hypothetical protein